MFEAEAEAQGKDIDLSSESWRPQGPSVTSHMFEPANVTPVHAPTCSGKRRYLSHTRTHTHAPPLMHTFFRREKLNGVRAGLSVSGVFVKSA